MASKTEILEIFPNEVWEVILANVKTAANYQKISNASPHFRTLLLPRAPELLFPEVVKPYVERQGKIPSSWTPLRGACRAWKQAVDRELQREEIHFKNEISETEAVFVPTFKSVEDFTLFSEHFHSTHFEATKANPFVCRAIKIRVDLRVEQAELAFYDACIFLLAKYGQHLWSVEVEECTSNLWTTVRFYADDLHHIMLSQMPNLRSLHLRSTRGGGMNSLYNTRLRHQMDLMGGTQFPHLEHLTHLEICGPVPDLVVTRFLESNPQVTRVNARRGFWEHVHASFKLLPNMAALAFTMDAKEECYYYGIMSAKPLEYLRLDGRTEEGDCVTYGNLFPTLEMCFAGSLSQLYLNLPPGKKTTEWSLTLPKLKTLQLRVLTGQSLEFLMPMRDNLEQLSLDVVDNSEFREYEQDEDDFEEAEIDGHIRLPDDWKQPHKWNIWTKFLKLRLVETGLSRGGPRYSGTRAEWKEWKKKEQP